MTSRRIRVFLGIILGLASLVLFLPNRHVSARADGIPTPAEFLGFRVGEDKKLARWDKIVEYAKIVAHGSERVRFHELGKTTNNNPFVLLEISSANKPGLKIFLCGI